LRAAVAIGEHGHDVTPEGSTPMRVVVAGAGVAGLETLVALRALAGARVALTLLAPVDTFAYRPLSTALPFTFRAERRISLRALAEGVDAAFVHDGLAQVDAGRGRVLTRTGDFLPFDAVVHALGVRQGGESLPGSRWSRGPGGVLLFAGLLREIEASEAHRVAFVVPAGAAWPPDAYELSLIAARAGGDVTVLTREREPLEALGQPASETVRRQLADAGIELRTGVELSDGSAPEELGQDAFSAVIARLAGSEEGVRRGGPTVLSLGAGETLRADRIVSLPTARGPAVAGVAHDDGGFIPVDERARASRSDRVLAAGDATTVRLKHSAIAAAQANAAAETIAAEAGADMNPTPWSPILYGILADPPHFPGPPDSVWLDGGEPITHCLWWPPGHVTGRHLAPYVAARDPVVRTGLLWHPRGVPVAAQVAGPAEAEHPPDHGRAGESIEADARSRQLLAIRRTERVGERGRRRAEAEGEAFDRREREVIARLQAAGYLRHAEGEE
jgi:sulfide:quinone oxidoreductase